MERTLTDMEICKKENPTALRSKLALKNALLSLLAEESLADISVAQICAGAQLTRPTFYNHYASKESLAAEIIDDALDEFAQHVRHAQIESTQGTLRVFLGFWESRWELLRLMFENGLLPMVGKRFRPHLEQIYSAASFTNKSLSSEELAFHNAFLSAGVAGMLEHWVRDKAPTSANALASYMENMLNALYAGMENDPS